MKDLMTTREVADYLRLKERKVYDMVAAGDIPCTRVTGKWLFPKHLIDIWLARSSTFPMIAAAYAKPSPPVIVGSHDPLLEWAVRTSDCELALMPGGSLDGLQRFARGEAIACGMHVLDLTDGGYNVAMVAEATVGLDCVLLEWGWREQGLLLFKGNPIRIRSLDDAVLANARFVVREAQAGSRVLFQYLVSESGQEFDELDFADIEARSETDVGLAVLEGKADTGLGIRAVANQLGLDFLPLHRERYDLLIRRRDYFLPSIQRLLAFAESEAFIKRAGEMTGYDMTGFGTVHFNTP
ncbi:MAG: helix-turn-helix transcriptional regulator [Rhodospirillales bacterium]